MVTVTTATTTTTSIMLTMRLMMLVLLLLAMREGQWDDDDTDSVFSDRRPSWCWWSLAQLKPPVSVKFVVVLVMVALCGQGRSCTSCYCQSWCYRLLPLGIDWKWQL